MFAGKIIENTLLILLSVLLAASCTTSISIVDDTTEESMPIDSISYIALGDSYTIGQGVEEAERWPNQLSNSLADENIPVKETVIIAKTGWTTKNLLDGIEDSDISYLDSNRMVSLLIGVNNQFQNLPFSKFESEFEILINIAFEMARSQERVFVVSIPDYGVTPFGSGSSERIAMEIDMYNQYIEARCIDLGVPFIDVTQISRDMGDNVGSLAPDNLHPSGLQYRNWVNKILPEVIELLQK